jgi:acetyl-CoA acyltransferase
MKAVICEYVRSPFTPAFKGGLAEVRPDDLIASTIKGLIKKSNVKVQDIEDLKLGCAFPEGEQGLNIARIAIFLSGLPISVAGVTINRFCGSSMQAIHDAVGAIALNMGELFICGGVESMSKIPMTGFNPLPNPALMEQNADVYESMGITAENVAKKFKIKRKEMEEFSYNSHQKAYKAEKNGNFLQEIIPYNNVAQDGCIRQDTTIEKLSELKPVFDSRGIITAGVSSPLTDGASSVIIASEDYANKNSLKKIAYVKSFAVSGCEPSLMGLGPIQASLKALKRAGLSIKDIDLIELNEAFASQAIACINELKISPEKVNIDGGAIALGHPLGATGARIVGKLATLLQRENLKYGLATQCIGGGQGIATIIERA